MLSEKDLIPCNPGSPIGIIEGIIGHCFLDRSLLLSALTRRSFWYENRETCIAHNERLEFLGDAVLGLIIADILYDEFPDAEEGELQKKRASLVNRSALSLLFRGLGLAEHIRMTRGDDISGCREGDSVLADTLEALIGAVYLDGGPSSARAVIERHFRPLIGACSLGNGMEDCKSRLQEKAQALLGVTPTYKVVEESGEDHSKMFQVEVYLGNKKTGLGIGRNKKEAAQNAAREALQALE
jgi:ribonuclease III